MITYLQAGILGAIQGIAELFPISSLGHSVIIPALLGWSLDQNANYFLIFLVATHLATALVLLTFFADDWFLIIRGIFRSLKNRSIDSGDTYAKLGWLLIIGTIPAGILGLLFEEKVKLIFASPAYVSIFLFLNGLLLYGAEILRKRVAENSIATESASHSDAHIAKLTWTQSIGIGFAQALALLPGFSRTGSALGGGLLSGLNHENAARFSFLLATPIILAAAVLKLPELIIPGQNYPLGPIVVGVIASGIAAYLSIKFLTRYFRTKTLKPFAVYCIIAGILSFVIISVL